MDERLAERIGKAVSRARRGRGMSQEHLAEVLDLSRGMVAQIERGERLPSVQTLEALAVELGLSLDEVVLARAHRPQVAALEVAGLLERLSPDHRKLVLELIRALTKGAPRAAGARGRSKR